MIIATRRAHGEAYDERVGFPLRRWMAALAFALLAIQVSLNQMLMPYKPRLTIVDPPPSARMASIQALGDGQFHFRWLALELENSGDSFGRFTALRHYDYANIQAWLHLLDRFDNRSNAGPSLASYLYGSIDNPHKIRHMMNYLLEHGRSDPKTKWWWLSQAAYMAKEKIKDDDLALSISYEVANSNAPNLPLWARQFPAFILEKQGKREAAFRFMEQFLAEKDKMTEGEWNYMRYFLKERLNILNAEELTPGATYK
jgi:hypothetical protein